MFCNFYLHFNKLVPKCRGNAWYSLCNTPSFLLKYTLQKQSRTWTKIMTHKKGRNRTTKNNCEISEKEARWEWNKQNDIGDIGTMPISFILFHYTIHANIHTWTNELLIFVLCLSLSLALSLSILIFFSPCRFVFCFLLVSLWILFCICRFVVYHRIISIEFE